MRALLARTKTEETLGFTISGTSEKEDTFALRSQLSQLIEGKGGSLS